MVCVSFLEKCLFARVDDVIYSITTFDVNSDRFIYIYDKIDIHLRLYVLLTHKSSNRNASKSSSCFNLL